MLGSAGSGNSSTTKDPSMPGGAPASNGMSCTVMGGCGPARPRRGRAGEQLLPLQAGGDAVLDFLGGGVREGAVQLGAGVVLGLEQAGDEQRLIVGDGPGFFLKTDVV